MRRRTTSFTRHAAQLVLDLLLPPQCLTCDAAVETQGQFCAKCFRATSFISAPCCRSCGLAFTHFGQAGVDQICLTCTANPPPWHEARAAMTYDDQARKILLPFKHADRQEHAQPLATMMARAGSILLARADIIVPVPLHRTRLRERHYNQAALLAHALAKHRAARAIPDALIRARPTPSLGSLTAAARAEIVGDAFAVRPHRLAAINGQRILLVDDVMTSGATARACTDVLLDAGAAAVDVLVAARVPDPRGT
jgi:ComF family protein